MSIDAEDIRGLVHAYAELLDEGNLDGVAALFEHATWRPAGREFVATGAAEARKMYDPVILYDGTPRTKHVISNVTIEIDGHRARARSYFTVMQAVPGFALQPILCGRYHDEFEKVGGEWRFTDRLISPDLVGDLSHHMAPGPTRLQPSS
jgi:3-phenylpropionate/cinnamic acid dioxygenase small subunit